MAARFSILDFHPVIGSELSGAIITDRRDPWAVVNDQRRIFDSFRGGGGARFTDGAAEHLPRGCNGKTVGCMHGCESVYIILEQIFCTRNDGARCVISTHLCHVIRLVILHIRSLGSDRTGENERGGADGRKRQREGRRWRRGKKGEEGGSLDTRKSKKRERNRPGTTRALQRLFLSAWGGGRDTIKSILPIGLSIP